MDTEECDLTVVVGFDSDAMVSTDQKEFSSAVGYLSHLIDILRTQLPNRTRLLKEAEVGGVEGGKSDGASDGASGGAVKKKVWIKNPLHIQFLEFDQTAIREGFMQGEAEAHKFAKQYLRVSSSS